MPSRVIVLDLGSDICTNPPLDMTKPSQSKHLTCAHVVIPDPLHPGYYQRELQHLHLCLLQLCLLSPPQCLQTCITGPTTNFPSIINHHTCFLTPFHLFSTASLLWTDESKYLKSSIFCICPPFKFTSTWVPLIHAFSLAVADLHASLLQGRRPPPLHLPRALTSNHNIICKHHIPEILWHSFTLDGLPAAAICIYPGLGPEKYLCQLSQVHHWVLQMLLELNLTVSKSLVPKKCI